MIYTILVIIVFSFILNEVYRRSHHFTKIFSDIKKIEEYCKHNAEFDVVNLGSNHPKYAFNYSEITKYNCANWAVGPEALEYDFFILKSYHEYIKEGGIVIIPICPLSMFLYRYKNKDSNLKYYLSRYKEALPHYSLLFALKEYYFPIFFHPRKIVQLFKKNKIDDRVNCEKNPLNDQELLHDADFWIKECWNPQFGINIERMQPLTEENIFSINKNIKILRDIVCFCIQNKLTPIICYLPITSYLGNKFSKEFIDLYIKRYVQEAINGESVRIIDLMKDNRFIDKDFYFNSFFMNKKGATVFTKEFIKELEK